MRKVKLKRGFSLVETLLYIAIMSTVVVALVSFLSVNQNTAARNQTINEVEQNGAQIMQLITQTIRNSTSITGPVVGTPGSTLTLVVSDGAKSPTIFDLTLGAIRIKEGTGTAFSISSNRVTASALTFTNLKPGSQKDSIKIQFTLTYNNSSAKQVFNYTQTFYGTADDR
ncbi:MAG: type II secretion system protein J [Candidatus Dojkabacteria bacterium]